MQQINQLVKELKDLESATGIEFRKPRIAILKKKIIEEMYKQELREVILDDWVVVHHPKVATKRFPYGIIQIMSKAGYGRMMEWKKNQLDY